MSRIRLYREPTIKYDFWVSIPENIENPKVLFWFTGSILLKASSGEFLYSECEKAFLKGISLFGDYIVITPCLPRLFGGWSVTTSAQELSIDTMLESKIKEKFAVYNRADLEILKIFEFIKEELMLNTSKFDVGGRSSGSCFSNIFSILHPEFINHSFCIGGGHQLLPFGEYSKELNYPMGISNISEIKGIQIDEHNIKNIKFFIYEGVEDMNDPIEFLIDFNKIELGKIRNYLGRTRIERTRTWINIMKSYGCNIKVHLIEGLGHSTNEDLGELIKVFNKDSLQI